MKTRKLRSPFASSMISFSGNETYFFAFVVFALPLKRSSTMMSQFGTSLTGCWPKPAAFLKELCVGF